MTAEKYKDISGSSAVVLTDGSKPLGAGYAGDFLSHVMGGAPSGCVWFTVMNNVNVAAVAHLADCAAVVLCDGTKPDSALLERCKSQNINLFNTDLSVFDACVEYARLCDKEG